jgi:antitoxin YefM
MTISAAEARRRWFSILGRAVRHHHVYRITHPGGNAVLLSAGDYEGLLETVELLSMPGMASTIRRARREIDAGETISFEEALG